MEFTREDTHESSPFGRYLDGVIDGLGDPRVSSVMSGPMAGDLEAFVRESFFVSFDAAVARLEEPFDGFPADVHSTGDSIDAAIEFVESEAPQHKQTVAYAILLAIGDFVVARRPDVIDLMKAAGEGPLDDRPGRMAAAARLLDDVRGQLPSIEAAKSVEDAEALIEDMRTRLESLREELGAQVLDDAIVWGARPEAEEPPRPGVPPLSQGGRRADVDDLLVDSWLVEMDMHLALAAKVGGPVTGTKVAGEEQREFVLDALVAVQEAFALRSSPEILLKFGGLRLAKGDVGEARMAAEKVMEMVDDEGSPLHAGAQELFDAVTEASPLTRRDRRCFIATAAMGDGDAVEVETLRAFRDRVLMNSPGGRSVVEFYYRVSPPVADTIAARPALKALVRLGLIRPAAALAWLFVRE